MSTRDELAMAMLRARSVIPESNRGERGVADALIAEGWRKKPSRRDLIDAYQVVWAEWLTVEAPTNTGYATFREHLADAILALMDRGQ